MRDNSVKLQRLIEELLDYQRALHAAASLRGRAGAARRAGARGGRARTSWRRTPRTQRAGRSSSAPVDGARPTPEKLRSIVDNLLGNAVKFTPRGRHDLACCAREPAAAATIDVIDSGPGVPLEEREAIFESFFRGRARPCGRVEGSGLGLAIAREFAEAHGGRIDVVAAGRRHFRVTCPSGRSAVLAAA